MSFMSSLAANPSGSVYGQGGGQQDDALSIVNQMKDRDMRDFQTKANFMSDLSLKQDRLKQLFNPETASGIPGSNAQTANGPVAGMPSQRMNTVMGQDPNAISGAQKAELGIRQQGVDVEKAKLAQQGKMGEEALGVKTAQEKLNQQKSDQINAEKQKELQEKTNEANGKLTQAQAALEAKTKAGESAIAEHEALAKAVEERHKLEMAQKEHDFSIVSDQHQQTIDNLKEQLKQKGKTSTTTEVNPEGTKRTTTTSRGPAAEMVNMRGKDGKLYPVPADKAEEAKTHPFFSQQGTEEP